MKELNIRQKNWIIIWLVVCSIILITLIAILFIKILPEIKKIDKQKEDKFREYNGANLAKDFSWDEAKGREIW